MPVTYSVDTYDVADEPGKDGEWTERASGVSLFGLRAVLREWFSRGYSDVSIYVARQDD